MTNNPKAIPKQPGFQPDWLSFEVHEALKKIGGEHVTKKQRTVMHMAYAIATETAVKDVCNKRTDTCSWPVWEGRDGKPGWRDDPDIQEALKVATERARWWVLVREGRSVQDALDELTAAAPAVARQMIRIAKEGRAAVVNGDQPGYIEADVKDVIKAADSILNRVSDKTADKAPANTVIRLTWGESGEEEQGA